MWNEKRGRRKRQSNNYNLLIIGVVILLVLILVLIFINIQENKFDETLIGELGTINPFGEESIDLALLIESSTHSGVSPIEESQGQIIELKSKPFFKNRAGGIAYKQQLREEHIILKQQIEQNLGKTIGNDIELMGEFEDAFNGITLDISKQECEFLKTRIDIIKECHSNLRVYTHLDTSLEVMKINLAYSEFGLTGEDITIAIIDTGIDGSHESLDDLDDDPNTNDPKIIGWKDFVNFKQNPYDDMGHGSHVAGIAAGTGGSAGIYKGVAPQANLVGVKVLDSWGSGYTSDVIAGIEWVIQNKDVYNISIISMSLGRRGPGDGTSPEEIAATTAVENGISFAVSAGNSGPSENTVGIPASAEKVITVGAIDDDKKIADFSSRGPTKDDRIKPEVSAVGVDVISSVPKGDCRLCDSSGWMSLRGTSMAAPHVAGIIALIKQANPNLNTSEIRQLLMNTAEDSGEEGPDNTYGWGIVDTLQTLLTIYPQEHELSIKNIESQKIYDTNTPIKITTLIKNKGLNNESNVRVRFLVDGVEQSNRIIDFIDVNSETSLEFIYASEQEGSLEISISIDPVNGENIIFDNNLTKEITIKDYVGKVKVVILDSWGTEFYQSSIFPNLNENWFEYGDYKIEIDYESFDKQETTYDLLKATNADVLVISDAWQDGFLPPDVFGELHWEFSDSEINAIKQYVEEGHGLIITSGTFNFDSRQGAVNNMKLAPLVGIDENSEAFWAERIEDNNFNIYYLTHELFNNLDKYATENYETVVDLNLNEIDPGDILAKSKDDLSIIMGHHYGLGNTIYFSNMIEIGGEDDYPLFYNAILWANKNHEQKSNDLKLKDINLEEIIKYGETNNISAKLVNKGGVSESNIKVKLLIDDLEKQNITISSLAVNEEVDIEFEFALTETGTHSVFIEVEELAEETKIYDNLIGENVFVPRASLTGIASDYGIDEDGDGLYEYLAIDIELNIIKSDDFNLNGLLTSQLGVEFETSYVYADLSPGVNNLTLKFNGLELRRMGLNGPYKLQNLQLSEEQGQGTVAIDSLYETNTYSYTEFESYPDLSISDIIKENEDDAKIIINKPTNIQVDVQNTGTEDAFDVNVSLYQRDSEDWDILTLINSSIINNISVFEEKPIIFEIIPDEVGYIDYFINISNDEDGNLKNNYYGFNLEVLAESADVWGEFYNIEKAVINQEIILTAIIENRGVQEAQNVNVSFYEEVCDFDCVEIFLSSQEIGALGVDETRELIFSFTPTKLRKLIILGNITADNEINKNNNRFYNHLDIVPEGVDVTGNVHVITYPRVINQELEVEIELRNIGTQKAENIEAILYEDVDDLLIEIGIINLNTLESDDYYYEIFSWTPTRSGDIDLVLEITADDDANLENNEIRGEIYIGLESPDIRIYFDFNDKLILNQENNILFEIYNGGVTEAQNVLASFYLREDDYYNDSDWVENFTLIDSKNIGNLAVNLKKETNFSYTPSELGYIEFKVNISADNEVEEYKENNDYWFNLKVFSGADLRIDNDYIRTAIINEEKNISFNLENNGIENALNTLVSFYLREDDYYNGSDWVENFTLIDSQNLGVIIVDEEKFVNFSYTPSELGYIAFKVNISADNEGNYEDNEDWFEFKVVNNGPDIDVNLQLHMLDNVVVDHKIFIPVEILNIGNQDANNIQLTLYNVSYNPDEQLTQISQKTITNLLAFDQTTIEFNYTPMQSGDIEFKLVSSLVGDVYSGNDDDYGGLEVLNSLTDVSGLFLFYNSYAINNEINYLDIEVRDKDIIGAQNVLVELYDDGTLVTNFAIPQLESKEVVFFEDVEWTPNYLGNHNLTLIITVDNDINLENNVYTQFIDVYNEIQTTFNIKNYLGSGSQRYLTVNENRFWVENGVYTTKIVNLAENSLGIDNIYYDETSSKQVFTVFLNSELDNEMNVTSEYYEDVSDGDLLFKMVYANNPNWSYDNLSYHIIYSDFIQGFNEVSIYGCLNWDFSGLKCQTDWIEDNQSLKYIGEEGIYATGKFDVKMDAIGLIASNNGEEPIPEPIQPYVGCNGCGGGGGRDDRGSGGSITTLFNKKEPNESLNIDLRGSDIELEFLGLRFVNEQQGGFINFRKVDSLNNAPNPKGKPYAYFSITHQNIANENIKGGELIFKVTKEWLEGNNFNKEDIILLRYEDNWRELPTHYRSDDVIYNYYVSDINALSIFAISTRQREEIRGFWIKFKFFIYILIAIVGLILLILILRVFRSKLITKRQKTKSILEAKDFIIKAREKGHGNLKIKEMFRKKGWKNETISKIIEDNIK